MSVPCSATYVTPAVQFCPFLSRWSAAAPEDSRCSIYHSLSAMPVYIYNADRHLLYIDVYYESESMYHDIDSDVFGHVTVTVPVTVVTVCQCHGESP